MPTFLVPRKSGAHRIAAIALYRALLSQCRAVPLQDEQRNALSNVLRNRFIKNRNLTSSRFLKDAFNAGYEALDHLDASTAGQESSTTYLCTLLSRLPASLTASSLPPPAASTPCPPPFAERAGSALLPRPRPLSAIKGSKRKIPVLVSANKIPILRCAKPQPANLSIYIKARIEQRQRRHDRRWELNELETLARNEDLWDEIVGASARNRGRAGPSRDGGEAEKDGGMKGKRREWSKERGFVIGETRPREPLWRDTVVTAHRQVCRDLHNEQTKNQEWAARMVGIVDREKELAEVERKEKVMRKNLERRERKRVRDEGKLGGVGGTEAESG